MYFKNIIVLADLNLDFGDPINRYSDVVRRLHDLGSNLLTGATAARVNFPFLDIHPGDTSLIKTNARRTETFDHVAFFIDKNERNLPLASKNPIAGTKGRTDTITEYSTLLNSSLRQSTGSDFLTSLVASEAN